MIDPLAMDREALEAENRALRKALEPFAKEADTWDDRAPDDLHPSIDTFDAAHSGNHAEFTIGDLRRARAALAAEPASGEANTNLSSRSEANTGDAPHDDAKAGPALESADKAQGKP